MAAPSWLKAIGHAIAVAAKDVVGFLGNPAVQNLEGQAAQLAELLLPAEAPLIQTFQVLMGKVFKQAVVSETAAANIEKAGSQKLAAVVAAIGPELDQWVANSFPGSATISSEVKAGLITAIVNLQNAITVAPATPAATPPAGTP